jgi:hypothetical protein
MSQDRRRLRTSEKEDEVGNLKRVGVPARAGMPA